MPLGAAAVAHPSPKPDNFRSSAADLFLLSTVVLSRIRVTHMPSRSSEEMNSALDEERALLKYWQGEHATALAITDEPRAEQCRRFVEQCELVVAALEQARVTSGGVAKRATGPSEQ